MNDMRAIVITTPGGPEVLQEQTLPIPDATKDSMVLRVRAFGLNHAECYFRTGAWGEVIVRSRNYNTIYDTILRRIIRDLHRLIFCKPDSLGLVPSIDAVDAETTCKYWVLSSLTGWR